MVRYDLFSPTAHGTTTGNLIQVDYIDIYPSIFKEESFKMLKNFIYYPLTTIDYFKTR